MLRISFLQDFQSAKWVKTKAKWVKKHSSLYNSQILPRDIKISPILQKYLWFFLNKLGSFKWIVLKYYSSLESRKEEPKKFSFQIAYFLLQF